MTNALKEAKSEEMRKIGNIIESTRVAMINTIEPGGKIISRPMYVQEIGGTGTLWFFSTCEGALLHQVNEESNIHLSFSDVTKNVYLSATGHASQVMDSRKMEELWDPSMQTWFKDGLKTQDICLLRVDLMEAEYWDSPSSPKTKFAGFIKSMSNGQPSGRTEAQMNRPAQPEREDRFGKVHMAH